MKKKARKSKESVKVMKCLECMKREADPKTGLCMDCSFEHEDFEDEWD